MADIKIKQISFIGAENLSKSIYCPVRGFIECYLYKSNPISYIPNKSLGREIHHLYLSSRDIVDFESKIKALPKKGPEGHTKRIASHAITCNSFWFDYIAKYPIRKEWEVSTKMGNCTLIGQPDRMFDVGNKVEIVEIKSGISKKPSVIERAKYQLLSYMLIMKRNGFDVSGKLMSINPDTVQNIELLPENELLIEDTMSLLEKLAVDPVKCLSYQKSRTSCGETDCDCKEMCNSMMNYFSSRN